MKPLLPALRLFALLSLLTGAVYPLAVTLVAQGLWPTQAGGSLLAGADGSVRGSRLLAQAFTGPSHFQARPSACAWAALPSAASNLSPDSLAWKDAAQARAADWRRREGLGPEAPVPPELTSTSASGLDPDLSLEAALFQVPGVARARGLDEAATERLRERVQALAQGPQAGLWGPRRVNVTALNAALDGLN